MYDISGEARKTVDGSGIAGFGLYRIPLHPPALVTPSRSDNIHVYPFRFLVMTRARLQPGHTMVRVTNPSDMISKSIQL